MIIPEYKDKGAIVYWVSPYSPEFTFVNEDCPNLSDDCKNDIYESLKKNWTEIMNQVKISCNYNCGDEYINCPFRNNRIIPDSPPDYRLLPNLN